MQIRLLKKKTQHLCSKILKILRIQRNYLNIINGIYDKLIVRIILNGKNFKEFPLKPRPRVTGLHPYFIQYLRLQLNQQDKDIKRVQTEKGEIK